MILTAPLSTKIVLPLQHFAEDCSEIHENSTNNLVAKVGHGDRGTESPPKAIPF